jgi:hypothetical protein
MANYIEDLSGLLQSFGPAALALLVSAQSWSPRPEPELGGPALDRPGIGEPAIGEVLGPPISPVVHAFSCPCFCNQRSRSCRFLPHLILTPA